jgi:lactoylglutathione lyase
MFRRVDCLLLRLPSLEEGLAFYRDKLGLTLSWIRPGKAAGLRMRDRKTELVLLQARGSPETDLLVDSVDEACRGFVEAGGSVVQPPFDIPVGRCGVVRDPWGNSLVLLDTTKGPLQVDHDHRVIDRR